MGNRKEGIGKRDITLYFCHRLFAFTAPRASGAPPRLQCRSLSRRPSWQTAFTGLPNWSGPAPCRGRRRRRRPLRLRLRKINRDRSNSYHQFVFSDLIAAWEKQSSSAEIAGRPVLVTICTIRPEIGDFGRLFWAAVVQIESRFRGSGTMSDLSA